ncbi:CPBP family intramembrane glutamic endopeptidase [Saccharopolyspora sp. 6V]|uniref:CPBP family intramembrane glutamic endopeptidase n=1 Tax=Saccharopolyspora sp. 6V TaxID=2877239 RepID=UPI001CD56EAD|nr:type II CAAX endopeptidase family protein [Saccharopolyspora sp. 6V]MCA1192680.1 CPBP family intramembrane metalloprotease [Saccharopolyspora sp. 6V]
MSSPLPPRPDRAPRTLAAAGPPHPPAEFDGTPRPFGTHLRMSWWKPLVVVIGLPLSMLLLQIALFRGVAMIEGDQAPDVLTPLRLLAVNLSMGITGLLAIPVAARFAGVPWRRVLSFPRRFDRGRLLRYLGGALVLVAGADAALAVLAPEATTWTTFGITGTTVTLLLVVVLTIPVQSLAEELMFRGAIMPALASWVRPVAPALVFGVLASSPVFALSHFAFDPWQLAYYTFLGVCFAAMAVISRGLEASIALHIANNALTSILNVLFAGGGALVLDRSAVPGGPHLLIPVPFFLAALAFVWWRERRGPVAGAAAR